MLQRFFIKDVCGVRKKGVIIMKNRKLIFLYTIIIAFGVTLAGCDSDITSSSDGPESIQPDRSVTAAPGSESARTSESIDLLNLFTNEKADGKLTIRKKAAKGTFTWQLKTSAFDAGHAYTVWIGNFDGTGLGNDGGYGAGGVVGGNGMFRASGNHCVWPLDQDDPTGLTGGFQPGTSPDCDMVDVTETIFFFILDHGEWEPGDMLARWDPTSGTGDPTVLEGILFAVIP